MPELDFWCLVAKTYEAARAGCSNPKGWLELSVTERIYLGHFMAAYLEANGGIVEWTHLARRATAEHNRELPAYRTELGTLGAEEIEKMEARQRAREEAKEKVSG